MDWTVRAARRGDGNRCKGLWEPWLGERYNQVMDGIDGRGPQARMDNRLFVANQSPSQVAGMVLTTPPVALLRGLLGDDVAGIMSHPSYRTVVTLAAVAVAPDLRGQGLGTALVQRVVDEACEAEQWMYGQFAVERNLGEFYRRFGFTVHKPGRRITTPTGVGLKGDRTEQWFELDFRKSARPGATRLPPFHKRLKAPLI